MNVLNRTVLEVKIGDRFYRLECNPDSPLIEVKEAIFQMNEYIIDKIAVAEKAKSEPVAEPQAE